jgi:hypothetical protein
VVNLERQAEALKRIYPSFDMAEEMKNPVFQRMTHPNVGISVEDAYFTVHRKQIQQATIEATAQQAAQKLSNAVQSGSRRPVEGGVSGQAPSDNTFSYKTATKEERDRFKAYIRSEMAAGRKVYPTR